MKRKGGDSDNTITPKTDFIDGLTFLPVKYRYMQIHQARNGDMNLEDIYKLIEICLYEQYLEEERLKNAAKPKH